MLRYLSLLVVILKMRRVWAAHVKSSERHVGLVGGGESSCDGLDSCNWDGRGRTGSLSSSTKRGTEKERHRVRFEGS